MLEEEDCNDFESIQTNIFLRLWRIFLLLLFCSQARSFNNQFIFSACNKHSSLTSKIGKRRKTKFGRILISSFFVGVDSFRQKLICKKCTYLCNIFHSHNFQTDTVRIWWFVSRLEQVFSTVPSCLKVVNTIEIKEEVLISMVNTDLKIIISLCKSKFLTQ